MLVEDVGLEEGEFVGIGEGCCEGLQLEREVGKLVIYAEGKIVGN